LTIENNVITGFEFQGPNTTIEIGGDLLNNNSTGSTLTSLDGTEVFDFNGSSSSLFRTSAVSFPNVTINRYGGNITLDDDLTITGVLTLSNGTVTSATTDLLTLSSSASYVGGSSSSYVNGPMIHTITAAETKTFPIGKSGVYRPIVFDVTTQASSPELQAEFFYNISGGTTDTTTMDTISSVSYYRTEVINAGTISATTAKISVGSGDGVTDLQTTVVARSSTQTGQYSSEGRSAYTGSPTNGTITSNSFDLTEAADFLLLGFEKTDPVQLTITNVSPNPITLNESFSVTVQSQSVSGAPANVTTNTVVNLTRVVTGTGSFTGTTSDTIFSGQNEVTISGVLYGTAENIQIEASRSEGENLTADTSSVITVASAFYSVATGDPATLSNWNSARDGSGSAPSTIIGLFIVQSGNTMTTTANFNEYDTDLRIESSGTFISNSGIMEIGDLIIESGGSVTANTEIEVNSASTFTINGGGTFTLNNTARLDVAEALFAGTESFADSSSFVVNNMSGNNASINVFAAATFGDLTINWTSNTALESFNGNFTAVNNTLTIQSTGTGRLEFGDTGGEDFTLNIGDDFIVSGGTVYVVDANLAGTVNVSGNLTVSSGELRLTDGGGDPTVNITGNTTVSGGTLTLSATDGGNSTLNISGNLSHTTGTITETANGSGTIVFNGTSAQTWTAGGTLSGDDINYTISNANGVSLSSDSVTVNGILTLSSGLFNTSDAALLMVSASGSISGGGASSMIVGPMVQSWGTATATKTFPIGKNSDYRPVELTLTTPSSPVIKAEMFNSNSGGTPDGTTV